jgi:hypothetical protein
VAGPSPASILRQGRYLVIVAADAPELAAAVRARVAPWAEYLTVVTDRRGLGPGSGAAGRDQRRGPPVEAHGIVVVACGSAQEQIAS